MKIFRMLMLLFGLALLFAAYVPLSRADEWIKPQK